MTSLKGFSSEAQCFKCYMEKENGTLPYKIFFLSKWSSSCCCRHFVDYPGCHICRLTLRRLFPTNHSKMWSQLPPLIRFRLPVSDLWLFCWPQQPPVMIHHVEWTATKTVAAGHSSVLELRKHQFLKKINVLKTFLEIETTHYLEGLDLKLNNETYAKVPNL